MLNKTGQPKKICIVLFQKSNLINNYFLYFVCNLPHLKLVWWEAQHYRKLIFIKTNELRSSCLMMDSLKSFITRHSINLDSHYVGSLLIFVASGKSIDAESAIVKSSTILNLVKITKQALVDAEKWGSVSCRWRYRSRMIACHVSHYSKIVLSRKNKNMFIPDKCCHLT